MRVGSYNSLIDDIKNTEILMGPLSIKLGSIDALMEIIANYKEPLDFYDRMTSVKAMDNISELSNLIADIKATNARQSVQRMKVDLSRTVASLTEQQKR